MAHVDVRDIDLSYPVMRSTGSLRKSILRYASLGLLESDAGPDYIWVHAIKGISFSAVEGDRIGLIGPNGAGKSSLLKVMAGIYQPDRGTMEISGSTESLVSLGFGIEPEETGYENIRFVLSLLGTSKQKIKTMEQDIADFTELGDFLDLPVRTYSSGMMTRLAFALATTRRPEILLMDEVIGAGDAKFYRKANERLLSMTDETKIIFLASHSNELIREWCNKAIWLDHGSIKKAGPTRQVLNAYLEEQDA